jgi:PBSX family phage terminase large subunit
VIAQPNQDAAREEAEFVLHPTQRQFFECDKPYKAFVAGIGGGKSYVGCFDLLAHSEPGCLVAVVAPTFRQLADSTQRSFVEVATRLGIWDEATYRKTDNQAMLKNGVEVLFRSGDEPGRLRGPNLRRAYLDEAGLMKEEVFNVMIGRLRYGGEQGALTATFTPQGKDHWTYRLFADEKNPNVELFKCSTKANPFLSPDFYNNLLFQYGKGDGGQLRAMQELEGEFVCVEGAEWGPECFGEGVWFNTFPDDDRAIRVITLDSSKGIGGKTGDYACFSIVMYWKGVIYVEFRMHNQWNTSEMASIAVDLQRQFKPHLFGIEEEFGGNVLADDLLNRADREKLLMPIVLVPTGKMQKEIRIRRLTPYLTRGMIKFRTTEETRLGVTSMESFPHAVHDDSPDSLEMAIRVINESGMV